MQTLTTTEKSKNTSAVTAARKKQQPFFAPLRVQPKLNLGTVPNSFTHEADAIPDQSGGMTKAKVNPIQSLPNKETVKTYSNIVSKSFSTTIRKADRSDESDSLEEGGGEPLLLEPAEGMLNISESDSIAAPSVNYAPVISNRATPPNAHQFGVTTTETSVTVIAIAPDAAAHVFNVTATLNNSISWSVHSLGRTNIPNANAAAITAGNYAAVASDLTPDMTSDNGRPPRTQFWAEDLTSQHEQFHANQRATTYGNPAFRFAVNWLTAQTANTAVEATALVNRLPAKMHESYDASYTPGKESRAYGDGALAYRIRATEITAKGKSGGYAAPVAPRAPRP